MPPEGQKDNNRYFKLYTYITFEQLALFSPVMANILCSVLWTKVKKRRLVGKNENLYRSLLYKIYIDLFFGTLSSSALDQTQFYSNFENFVKNNPDRQNNYNYRISESS